jgi:biopolymer transport protein ExbD
MSTIYKRGNANVQANVTPMIDVTFLLIVFFVLVSQIVEVEHVDMELPRPDEAATTKPSEDMRVVINVLPGQDGTSNGYRLGSREYPPGPQGAARLSDRLIELYDTNPSVRINLRADRSTHYQWIEPVLQAISTAAARSGHPDIAARVNLVVIRED